MSVVYLQLFGRLSHFTLCVQVAICGLFSLRWTRHAIPLTRSWLFFPFFPKVSSVCGDGERHRQRGLLPDRPLAQVPGQLPRLAPPQPAPRRQQRTLAPRGYVFFLFVFFLAVPPVSRPGQTTRVLDCRLGHDVLRPNITHDFHLK